VAEAVLAMTADDLAERLLKGFSPQAAPDFDGTVRLVLEAPGRALPTLQMDEGQTDAGQTDAKPPGSIGLRIDHGHIERMDGLYQVFDITLYFHTADEACNLLCGSANPVAAFMEGRFRSDGYLLWVFAVLSMFRGR
jgi:hypothetical protein